MMEAIKIPIYLSEKRRQGPIYIVDDSTVPISAEFKDAGNSLEGAEVIVYAKSGDVVQFANCYVDGNTTVFTHLRISLHRDGIGCNTKSAVGSSALQLM